MPRRDEVKVGAEGRVLLPAEVRRAVGIEPGSTLLVRVEGEHVVLIPRSAIKRRLREMFRDVNESLADELIAERRAEAARERSAD